MCEFLFYILIMSKVHCKRVINLVFSVGNTIFANAPGKNHWLRRKETETTLRDSIWTANDNREKKIHSGRFMLFVKHQNFTQDVTK